MYIGNEKIRLSFSPERDGYNVCLYLKEKNDWILIAESGEVPIFVVRSSYSRYSGGKIKEVKINKDNSVRIYSDFRDFDNNKWGVKGKINFFISKEVPIFLYEIDFIYSDKKINYFLSVESWFKLNCQKQPFYLVPGVVYYAKGNQGNWFKEEKIYDKSLFYVPELAPSLFCSYPFLYLWWKKRDYCLLLEKAKSKICPCLGMGKKGENYYAGISYIHWGKDEFYEKSILPFKISSKEKFKLLFYQTAKISSKLHNYSSYLKFWYFNFGEHGNYNRWASPKKILNLLSQGFKYHYDKNLKILRDVVHFSGKNTFLHREMTNGWTSGAMAAYHMLRLGYYLKDRELIQNAINVLDNISSAITPSGFYYSSFDDIDKKWKFGADWWGNAIKGKIAGTPISETTFYMLLSYKWLKENKKIEKKNWLESALNNLEVLCKNNPDGIFGMYFDPFTGKKEKIETPWNRPWSFNMNWVAALSLAYRITNKKLFLEIAKKAGRYYYRKIFSKGSLLLDPIDDAAHTSLDESVNYALRGYIELYFSTKEKEWLNYAIELGYYACTFKFAWNVPLPKNSYLDKQNYKTIGWSLHHYGLQNVNYLIHLWEITKEEYFLKVAIDAIKSAPQPICRYKGEQGGKHGMCCEGVWPWSENTFTIYGPGGKAWGQIRERISHIGPISWITHALLVYFEDFKYIMERINEKK